MVEFLRTGCDAGEGEKPVTAFHLRGSAMQRLFWWLSARTPGLTYYRADWRCFSINEGRYPTVLLRWRKGELGFYLALCRGLRAYWFQSKKAPPPVSCVICGCVATHRMDVGHGWQYVCREHVDAALLRAANEEEYIKWRDIVELI